MNLPQFGILRLRTGEPDARRRDRQPTRGRQPRKLFLFLSLLMPCALFAQEIPVAGRVVDPQGKALAGASVELMAQNRVLAEGKSDSEGEFHLSARSAGQFMIKVDAPGFRTVVQPVTVTASGNAEIVVAVNQLASRVENVTVTANSIESVVLSPDPSGQVFAREELMSANPGQPGAPLAIPGYPIETASSGIKAPQYFAPGVAGDHGEPIAQFVAVGSYLVPNNLSANAHGNGYSDPNILIPEVLESVQVDGGAFDVREGNHSVNLAATYALEPQLQPFLAVTADYRDIAVVAAFAPSASSWIAFAGSYGNGFLDRLEHRQQYKFNGQRVFQAGAHRITLFAIAYYGSSYVPGLVPLFPGNALDAGYPNLGDTIDPRQKDQTHTALAAVNDVWQLGPGQQFELSGFFRTYNLSLYSDFGQGLIRQSEFRTVAGGSANYVKRFRDALSLLAGFDYEREAPRRDNLDHYGFFDPANPGFYGPFTPVDSNNVTISPLTPYLAAGGALWNYFRYYLGWRRDEIDINNQDLLHPQNSFEKWVGVDSPKASVSFLPKESWFVPLLSFSYGQAFFTEDPRIGTGTAAGTPVAVSHSYQLVASKNIHKTDLKLTLGRVGSSATLAKLDPDTGLQFDEGPSRLRYLTASVRRNFAHGSLLATLSKADARDLDSGQPTPEAPRTIFDLLGTVQKLPLRLQMQGEFEYVGRKPLGTGCLPDLNAQCAGTAVEEFRGALARPFLDGRLTAAVNFLIASGYTGQTTENFFPSDVQEVVGVRIPSYASVTLTYRIGRNASH